ncbi:sigma-70 family RNA polymerase sigma factor [Pseudomonas syringae]|uniref:sigma-70 family RNA polymerase sigma factor n=1 Tax=Pseudomonas syringae TaxID=317 RepID=UPI003F75464F
MTDNAARLELYLKHRPALINYACAVIGERTSAEDVVQDAFLRFCALSVEPVEQPLAYLYRIVRNLALDSIRRNAAQSRQQQSPPDWMLPSPLPTPEQSLLQSDEIQRMALRFSRLPEQMRIAVEMHRLGGYTFQQIAAHLEVSVSTVHRLVKEAVVHLASADVTDNAIRTSTREGSLRD